MKIGALLRAALLLAAFGLVLVSSLSLFPSAFWVFEVWSNLRPQWAALAAFFAILFLFAGPRIAALPLSAAAGLHAFLAMEAASLPRAAPASAATLRVMTVNIDFRGRDDQRLIGIVKRAAPDILVLVEGLPEDRRALARAIGLYSHRAETGIDNRAISIESRFPLTDIGIESTDYTAHILTARALLPASGGGTRETLLIATHPLAPLRPWQVRQRAKALAYLGARAGAATMPVLILGDLNLTAHSPLFHELLRAGRLRDSALARTPQPTWMTPLPLLGLRIDHVLVSAEFRAGRRMVTDPFGSDHFGVILDLELMPLAGD